MTSAVLERKQIVVPPEVSAMTGILEDYP